MRMPKVAIVGRPNVGKSSLFNWLAGRRISIVDPTPGVTRDRITAPIEVEGKYFELTDTGGMGIEDIDKLTEDVEKQIRLAIDQSDALLFVVDARTGPVPLDDEVARRLRSIKKPILLVANKCDHAGLDVNMVEFYQFGFGDPHAVSTRENRGKHELLDWIVANITFRSDDEVPDPLKEIKLAIVGRRNTGKSTFINCLAQEERTIVSEVEGTTRDSIDVRYDRDGVKIIAIDTAGVRHKGSVKTDIDFYSMARAERSIRRADVVLHFFDAPKTVSMVDKQLAGYILENYKPAIFVVNKWDLVKDSAATGEFADYLRKVFPNLDHVPIAFITAKDGKNVQKLVNLAQNIHKQSALRVGTGDLNRVLKDAMTAQGPPVRQNRMPKVYYATQVAMFPPTIVLFTNGPELFDKTYLRYLMKAFRNHLPFPDVPIKMYVRARNREDMGDGEEGKKKRPVRIVSRNRKKTDTEVGEVWTDL
jgi:GTP-binding protein